MLWLYLRWLYLLLTGLSARLQAVSPEVKPGDYYDEDRAQWDREGMQSDLKLAKSAIKQAAMVRGRVSSP